MSPLSQIPLAERPALVRAEFSALDIDGFYLPRGDEFLGEYVPASSERLAWLTGFTGSAGLAILLSDRACVFSDGRYTQQLEAQVETALWERRHTVFAPPAAWLAAQPKGLRLGYDPKLASEGMLDAIRVEGITLVPLDRNPIDAAWTDRPAAPATDVIFQNENLSGESSTSKRLRLAETLRKAGQNAVVLSDTASVAWLLNIRATDVPCTPLALAFSILHDDGSADLFIEKTRLSPEVIESFGNSVRIHAPERLGLALDSLCHKIVRLDRTTTPQWFARTLKAAAAHVVFADDPCALPKACKNTVEQAGARAAQSLDGVALIRFLHWFEGHGVGLSETQLSDKLETFRALSPHFLGNSFDAISGAGPNAALMHYRAIEGQDRKTAPDELYLIDSGGQYPSGTTDVTRTIWTGPGIPPAEITAAYTRVLKGHIALSCARFPKGINGFRLDTLARMALWQAGLDYDHGTGHGIGSYLSVHEGPCNISSVPRLVGLEAGMILSNEPGYYLPGHFGMRTENLLLITQSSVAGDKFLEFETLTFVPYDRRLIDLSLLSTEDISWIDAYHGQVLERHARHLDADAKRWLQAVCAPLI